MTNSNDPNSGTTQPWAHWLMVALAVALGWAVLQFVDLAPHVDENFFFASEDPSIKQGDQIDKNFPTSAQLYLAVTAPDITTAGYAKRIGEFSGELEQIAGVKPKGVRSIARGPRDLKDAQESPLWKRLLVAENQKSTYLIISVDANPKEFIASVEKIVARFAAPDFRIHIAGSPYVIELIRRNLVHDLIYFSIVPFVLFGVAVGLLFRSGKILLGTLTTCASAMALTLLIQDWSGMFMGILTTNLSTMVFVITLSHIVFMTNNWREIAASGSPPGAALTWAAWRRTLHPSFWCMATTVLGFGSLLFVSAKPLRDLGVGGCIGTAVGMVCAYTMYPVFLHWMRPRAAEKIIGGERSPFWSRAFVLTVVVVGLLGAALALRMPGLETDPSVLEYFGTKDPIRTGLEYVDQNGGSSPLKLVVRSTDGEKLDTNKAYARLWEFQRALEKERTVGVVMSLPVLVDEAARVVARETAPFSIPLTWETVEQIRTSPVALAIPKLREQIEEFDRTAKSFISDDRKEAMFMMRMAENKRPPGKRHEDVVEQLKELAQKHGFTPVLVGGVYHLEGRLADQVNQSLLRGLGWLFVLFALIALFVARSLRGGLAMIAALGFVPIFILGGLSALGMPVDIISAPATNVCIGMAVDSMIHLVMAVRRRRKDARNEWEAWTLARQEQWRGVIGSCTIVAAGFAIFLISSFPPTQRFGLGVVLGTVIAAVAALLVLPLFGGWRPKR